MTICKDQGDRGNPTVRIYKTYNLTVRFSKYEFYKMLLGGVKLLKVHLQFIVLKIFSDVVRVEIFFLNN